jgi:two-component system, OmpR family, sensor histidine kinase KdpD
VTRPGRGASIPLAVLAVAATTGGARIAALNPSTTGLLFLLVVLFSATLGGLLAGISASIAATVAFNYFFLPPIHTFHISDPENWATLAAFLVVSSVASRLVTLARGEAERANARATEVQTLYDLSVQLFLAASNDDALARSASRALAATGARGGGVVVFGEDEEPRRLAWITASPDETVGERARSLRVHRQTLEYPSGEGRDLYVPMGTEREPHGALVALGTTATRAAVESIARLLTLAMERERLLVQRAHVEALRESESMKTALLRAVSHDLSTPLTAITVQVASLQRQSTGQPTGRTVSHLADEVARLRRRIDNLLAMARLETGSIAPRPEPIPAPDLFRAARENLGAGASRRIAVRVTPGCPEVFADPSLALEIIVNLVENAEHASPPDSVLELVADRNPEDPEKVRLGILDRGRGIEADRSEADATEMRPGGLGLEIARRFAAASGGSVALTPRDGGGTCAWVDLPVAQTETGGALARAADPGR